jgi:hypothetical protein
MTGDRSAVAFGVALSDPAIRDAIPRVQWARYDRLLGVLPTRHTSYLVNLETVSRVKAAIAELCALVEAMPTKTQEGESGMSTIAQAAPIEVFVSHWSEDAKLATLLVDLLCSAIGLKKAQIRCTSVDGCKLPGGAHTSLQLRGEIRDSKVFLALITVGAVDSSYVLFDLGARWMIEKFSVPLVGPSAGYDERHALKTTVRAEMLQMLEEVSKCLGRNLEPPASYDDKLQAVCAFRDPGGPPDPR